MNENYNPNEQVLQYKDHSGFFSLYDKQKQIIMTLLAGESYKECRKAIEILIAHTATYLKDPKSYLDRLSKEMKKDEIIAIYAEISKEHSMNELQPKIKVETESEEELWLKEEKNLAFRNAKYAMLLALKN
jgi:hypothetical protein